MTNIVSRSQFLRLAALSASILVIPSAALADENEITRDMIFNDPETPTGGNPNGDLTIVDFFDYNCPYCKGAAKPLEKVVKADGNIRLVYKDWPILHPTSIIGARLALGAKYQGKYLPVHHALMNIDGYGVEQERMIEATHNAGVDVAQLDSDMATHADDIARLVKRNLNIAEAIGLQGTPGFLVGPFKVNQALNEQGFVRVVADARARQKSQKTK
ncbi:DsbA family protein [Bradyrhizobium sp. 180]|uniref:DsbA family protein n=1 Tax=Bradyrhizobium sp. 180 TaxID=2782650 RepID=UPI001FFC2324|nr:DsbA family protein [Bradyrhizobium sp. 180]MCK1492126.1 DsbA family protein [Bradyrhizobium sp. 180]